MNRRDFVVSGAAASVAALTPLTLEAFDAKAAAPASIPLHKVVYDSRYAACRDFGAAARRSGAEVAGFDGDVTALWFHELGPRWARGEGPVGVGGMTTPGALFCLEQMARDHWLRTVVRAEHVPRAAGGVRHRVTAHAAALMPTCNALNYTDWPARLGAQLLACPVAGRRGRMERETVDAARGPAIDAPLVSWVIST